MKGLPLFSLAVLLTVSLLAQQPAPPLSRDFIPAPGKLVLKDGDTFVFLGDSITHQCLYTQYIEDFYYTRFPKTRIHFHNAGTSGDRAADVMARLEEDVASFKPGYVSVLLGMNDGGFTDAQPALFDTYKKDMTTLLDAIEQMGAWPVLLTPTMYDALPNRLNNRGQEPRDTAYSTVLGTYGAWLKEQAKLRQFPVADFYKPLNDATTDQRRIQADWTIIPDGMHPAPEGHVLMAATFLNEVAFRPPVSEIVLTRSGAGWSGNGANGLLADLQGSEKITFTFTAQSLPWVLPPEADRGRKLIKPEIKSSRERVVVRDLKPGTYELKIDDAAVGQWTEKELAAGIDLGENTKTPQYQQALKVALLNEQRNAKGEHPLRIPWAQLKGQRAALQRAEETEKAPAQLANRKKSFDTWYESMRKNVAEFVADSRSLEDEIYKVNEPVARKYELTPVPAGTPQN